MAKWCVRFLLVYHWSSSKSFKIQVPCGFVTEKGLLNKKALQGRGERG
jgi:hypothetical protein